MFDFHAIPWKAIKNHEKKCCYQIQQCRFFTQKIKTEEEGEEKTPVSDRFEEIRGLINDVHGDLLPYFFWKLI